MRTAEVVAEQAWAADRTHSNLESLIDSFDVRDRCVVRRPILRLQTQPHTWFHKHSNIQVHDNSADHRDHLLHIEITHKQHCATYVLLYYTANAQFHKTTTQQTTLNRFYVPPTNTHCVLPTITNTHTQISNPNYNPPDID